jgi:hypothetical protein
VNERGSHDENPNGGVQMGVAPDGAPNLLEEGEPVYQDYVFSDNINAEREFLDKHHLPASYDGKLYSEIADMNVEREARGKTKNYSYMWHISYFMTRFMEKFKGYDKEQNTQKREVKRELYDFCLNLRNEQLLKSRNLELLAIAARWAELTLKDKENNN